MHETALRELVGLRGGLEALGSEVLQIFISWYALANPALVLCSARLSPLIEPGVTSFHQQYTLFVHITTPVLSLPASKTFLFALHYRPSPLNGVLNMILYLSFSTTSATLRHVCPREIQIQSA